MKLGLIGIVATLVLAAAAIAAVTLVYRSFGATSPGNGSFRGTVEPPGLAMPRFLLRDQHGRRVSPEDLRGKVVVLTFLDSKCREACPIIAGEITAAWRLLTPREHAQSAAVAISTNPRDDTPASVRAFLKSHRASRTIRYLVGPLPVMRGLWHRFQILSSYESGNAATHSDPVRVYSRDLVWLETEHVGVDLSPQNLAHDIRLALNRRS